MEGMEVMTGTQNVTIKTASLIREMLCRVYSILALTDLIGPLSVMAGGLRVIRSKLQRGDFLTGFGD